MSPPLSADDVAQRTFPTSFRGFDAGEVRAFLGRVGERLREAEAHVADLTERLAAAEERAAHPQLDVETITTALGDETARILKSAQDAAQDIRAKAEENVAHLLREAHEEASRIRAEAESVLAEETDAAQGEARRILEEAEGAKERVLGDLARRRRVAHTQVEQLRAGRERLLEAYRVVRSTLDEVTDELVRAEAEARQAAEAVVVPESDGAPAPQPVPVQPVQAVEQPEPSAPPRSSVRIIRPPKDAEPPRPEEPPLPEEPEAAEPAFVPAAPPPDPAVEGVRVLAPQEEPPLPEEPDGPEAEVAEPEPEPDEAHEPDEAPSAVEELFARIRADVIPKPAPEPEPQPEPAVLEEESRAPARDSSSRTDEGTVGDDGEAALQRRDAAVEDVEQRLTRRLKRALQDEQNDVLDRLRVHRGRPTAAALLPTVDDHAPCYREAAASLLAEAVDAGARFLDAAPADAKVEDLVTGLADDVVAPLRRRLERSLEEGADEEHALVVERIGAAYREVKGRRVEQLASDYVVAAFSRGLVAAAPEGALLRWVVDDGGEPCPDCDDNVLAGPTLAGEAYPTGQAHPPAHAGCRCLLVPTAP
jgi:DivIVA domain-containing protein